MKGVKGVKGPSPLPLSQRERGFDRRRRQRRKVADKNVRPTKDAQPCDRQMPDDRDGRLNESPTCG